MTYNRGEKDIIMQETIPPIPPIETSPWYWLNRQQLDYQTWIRNKPIISATALTLDVWDVLCNWSWNEEQFPDHFPTDFTNIKEVLINWTWNFRLVYTIRYNTNNQIGASYAAAVKNYPNNSNRPIGNALQENYYSSPWFNNNLTGSYTYTIDVMWVVPWDIISIWWDSNWTWGNNIWCSSFYVKWDKLTPWFFTVINS